MGGTPRRGAARRAAAPPGELERTPRAASGRAAVDVVGERAQRTISVSAVADARPNRRLARPVVRHRSRLRPRTTGDGNVGPGVPPAASAARRHEAAVSTLLPALPRRDASLEKRSVHALAVAARRRAAALAVADHARNTLVAAAEPLDRRCHRLLGRLRRTRRRRRRRRRCVAWRSRAARRRLEAARRLGRREPRRRSAPRRLPGAAVGGTEPATRSPSTRSMHGAGRVPRRLVSSRIGELRLVRVDRLHLDPAPEDARATLARAAARQRLHRLEVLQDFGQEATRSTATSGCGSVAAQRSSRASAPSSRPSRDSRSAHGRGDAPGGTLSSIHALKASHG